MPDKTFLANATLDYLSEFDTKTWHDDPVRTLIRDDEIVSSSSPLDTLDAFNNVSEFRLDMC